MVVGTKASSTVSALASTAVESISSPSPPAEQAPTPAGRVCVVAAAFVPSEDWQLACAAGDRVTVTTEDDGLGWVEVVREADGAKGLVPLSYLTTE